MATNNRYVKKEATLNTSVPRSRMPLGKRVIDTYLHGYLYPVGAPIEVLPGDTFKCDISHLTRMSAPIFPIMDNIQQHYAAFFCPKRLIWEKTKQFYGEAEDFGIADSVQEPFATSLSDIGVFRGDTSPDKEDVCRQFGYHFGLVADDEATDIDPINVLPLRAFLAVYNEHFRDENFCPKYMWNKSETGSITTGGGFASISSTKVDGYSELPKVKKQADLFVNSLPWAQKGDPVDILAGVNSLVATTFDEDVDHVSLRAKSYDSVEEDSIIGSLYVDDNNFMRAPSIASSDSAALDSILDFKLQPGVTINDLRFMTAYQLYLERLGHSGSRYGEVIKSMFGVQISDTSAQIPEFLGSFTTNINIDQVIQTTGHVAGQSSTLGQLGANSVSGRKGHLFVKSFDEPGYIVIVTYFKHQRTYTQGLDPVYLKHDLLDYYQPPFANLGDQPISKALTYWTGSNAKETFGFQEPWFDYRSYQDRCFGLADPGLPNSINFLTLSESFSNAPILGASFVEEDRDNLIRCLTTGEMGPDYICDTMISIEATRCIPLWSNQHIGVL